jgi:hypothetical protein
LASDTLSTLPARLRRLLGLSSPAATAVVQREVDELSRQLRRDLGAAIKLPDARAVRALSKLQIVLMFSRDLAAAMTEDRSFNAVGKRTSGT